MSGETVFNNITWGEESIAGSGSGCKGPRAKEASTKRERKPLRGMMLHIDGSHHRWFAEDERWHDLIVVLDDATSEIYYAQLVEAESIASVMTALRQVIETKGIFCSLYSDRASHFWLTPKAGEAVDRQSVTQLGRALRELGIKMIPAYSPQARGRSERSFRTWQGRLPQELRIREITDVDGANRFLKGRHIREFNRRFTSPAAEPGASAFVPCTRSDLDRVFPIQTERTVNRDNTVQYNNVTLQIDRQSWRRSMDGCRVTIYQHLNGVITIGFGPQEVGRYTAAGRALNRPAGTARHLKPKRLAAPLSNCQTGHSTC